MSMMGNYKFMMSDIPKNKKIVLVWLALLIALCIWSVVNYFANAAEENARRLVNEKQRTDLHGFNTRFASNQSAERAKLALAKMDAPKPIVTNHSSLVSATLHAMQVADAQGATLSKLAEAEIKKRMSASSFEELAALLAELDASTASRTIREQLEIMAYQHMAAKDPRRAMELGLTRIYTSPYVVRDNIYNLFQLWAWKQPSEVESWLDQQIADGKLDPQSGNGNNKPRNGFEQRMFMALLAFGKVDNFEKRLGKLPEKVLLDVLDSLQVHTMQKTREAEFFNVIRKYVDNDSLMMINLYRKLSWNYTDNSNYAEVSRAIERIGVPQRHRSKLVESAVSTRIAEISYKGPVTPNDFNEARAWTQQQAPEILNRSTGELLTLIAQTHKPQKFEESMMLLETLKDDPGRDEIVKSFIYEISVVSVKHQALPLVETISDPALRDQTRNYLKRSIAP